MAHRNGRRKQTGATEDSLIPRFHPLDVVAKEIGMPLAWVEAAAETNLLPCIRLNSSRRSYRVSEAEFDAWREGAAAAAGTFVGSFIYFIQPAWGGPIKVGLTNNIARRFDSIQSCSPLPLRLLAYIPGTRKTEAELHEQFSDWRMHGEWFAWDAPGLMALVVDAQQKHGVPAAKSFWKGSGETAEETMLLSMVPAKTKA